MHTESVVMAKKQDAINQALRLLRENHYVVIDSKHIKMDYYTRHKQKLSRSNAAHYWDLAYGYCWMEMMESMLIIAESKKYGIY
ncbi:hypothetical protein UFOVP1192_36 [uncultured Caudovirales phage]|uniref:Uncharacterized protein n=1 Tax=uncultured Caudovirales phage TaxID=2100421 RepID=A0A6J5R6T3_9CAUD|nr:hypothetical protein UFOVP1192_36 [uncultured Caudovirales phage]